MEDSNGRSAATPSPILAVERRRLVVRRRLIALVDTVALGKVVALAAPAGWGKSELLLSWEEHREWSGSSAWLSLEPGDGVAGRFWRRFLAAVQATDWANRSVLGSFEVAPDGEIEPGQFLRAILDRVPADAEPLAIILDDLHLLAGGSALDDLSHLVNHLPPSWRLILSGRFLPVPLTRLRVAGVITAIGTAELAFDDSEATALVTDAGRQMTMDDAQSLVASTQGWAAGIRLASIPLMRGDDVAAVLEEIRGGQHDVEGFFDEEVLSSLAPFVADFLRATCVAPILDVGLAEHLSGRDDAAALLHELSVSGVFTVADRALHDTYRYHPLMAGALERHLRQRDPRRFGKLHSRAARWYRERGKSAAAWLHAVASQDWPLCLQLLDDLWVPLFVSGDLKMLAELLTVLPRSTVENDRGPAALQALVSLDGSGAAAGSRSAEDGADDLLRASRPELVLTLETARRAGQVGLVRRAAAQLLKVPVDAAGGPLRAYVLLCVGVAEYWADERSAAERDLREALVLAERGGLDYLRLGCLSQLVGVLTAQNRVNDAEVLAREAAALATDRGWEGSGWAAELWHALGWIYYLRCELDTAATYLDRAERAVWRQDAVVGAIIPTITALVARLAGRRAEAIALLNLADARLPVIRDEYVFLDYIDAERARYAVEAGELRLARELLGGGIARHSLHHCVAMGELLVAEGRPADARAVLAQGLAEADGYLDQRLHVMVLLASLQTGEIARATMRGALRLAAPEVIVQPFCQVGKGVLPLITDIGRSDRQLRPFARRIRDRLADLEGPSAGERATGPEELTVREIEVLRVLDGPETLAEAASGLHVSPNTLKAHTRNIYAKLGVKSRRQALAESTRRGLL